MVTHKLSFLFIDSNKEDAFFYQKLLDKSPFLPFQCKVTHATSLKEGLDAIEKKAFHLILTNFLLPDCEGVEIFERLHHAAPHTPIVILADSGEEHAALEVIGKGAQDYLLKEELSAHSLSRIVRFAIERHHLQESFKELSFTDELTGVYNRRGFMTLAEQQIELSKRLERGFFLFLFDLDYLKHINDTYGHPEGDKAIQGAVEVLKKSFRSSDIVARLGGDEFAVLAITSSPDHQKILISNFHQALSELNETKSTPYELSISYGECYFSPKDALVMEDLFTAADSKLYERKRARIAQ